MLSLFSVNKIADVHLKSINKISLLCQFSLGDGVWMKN